ncbi:MAG: hypothetical protein AAF664_23655, partial [Planctomycetota bacterium]
IRRNPTFAALVVAGVLIIAGLVSWDLKRRNENRANIKASVTELAMSGRFDDARAVLVAGGDSLTKAEQDLLEGQILMFSGKDIAARAKFDSASSSGAGNTTAQSLLAISSFLSGDEDGYLTKLKAVADLPVNNNSDRLFKGYALHWFAPDQAIALLTTAQAESSRTHLAEQVMLAEAKLVYAMGVWDRQDGRDHAEQARNKLEFVRDQWDKSVNLRFNLMNANLTLALIHRDLGNHGDHQRYLAEAKDIADELTAETFRDEKSALPLLNYYMIADEEQAMIDLTRQRMASGWKADGYQTHGYFEVMMPSLLYGRGDTQLALQIYNEAPSRLRNLTAYIPAFLAMDSDQADARTIQQQLEKDLDERLRDPYTGVYAELDWVALRMLGADDKLLHKVADRVHYAYKNFFIGANRERGMMLVK